MLAEAEQGLAADARPAEPGAAAMLGSPLLRNWMLVCGTSAVMIGLALLTLWP